MCGNILQDIDSDKCSGTCSTTEVTSNLDIPMMCKIFSCIKTVYIVLLHFSPIAIR